MRPALILAAAFAFAPTLAPAEGARGAASPCVEVVTFRLVAGADESVFVQAARATEAPARPARFPEPQALARGGWGLDRLG